MTPLRRRMTEDLILHNRSPKTIRLYINWVADFARHFHASPDQLGPEHVRSYLLHLIQERQASCNVHKQARLALQFFYRVTLGRDWVVAEVARPKAPKKLPVVLSQDEMARILDALRNPKHRALLMTAYAGGLRLSEVAGLRPIDGPQKFANGIRTFLELPKRMAPKRSGVRFQDGTYIGIQSLVK